MEYMAADPNLPGAPPPYYDQYQQPQPAAPPAYYDQYQQPQPAAPLPYYDQHQQYPMPPQPQPQPQPQPSSYQPHPSPNPNPIFNTTHDAPPLYSAAALPDARALHPTGVPPYMPDPYAPHGGYEGLYAASGYTCQPPAPAAPPAPYYQGAAGVGEQQYGTDSLYQQQYGVNSLGQQQYGMYSISHRPTIKNAGRRTTFENLNTKRQKLIKAGAPAGSVKVCTVCNVVCNSDTVFAAHLAGEKHASKAIGRSSNGKMPLAPVNVKHKVATTSMGTVPKKAIRSFYCEVCKIDCNSQDILSLHKDGKKHKRNLQKLQELITAKPLNVVTIAGSDAPVASQDKTVGEQLKKKAVPATEEDLNTKKRKVLDSGTAAEEIKMCTLCNVICNSQTVFDSHMEGRKHATMVKQQQQT